VSGTASRIASVATLTVCLSMAGIAAARAPAETTVTFKGTGDYWGVVKSTRPLRCAKDRKVVVYKQAGAVQSPSTDQKIGSDTASLNGSRYEWSIGQPGVYGKLYARAGRTPDCLPDSSPTVRVPRP
jgi:hypothetical protein